jgi:hypothetical protein
MNRSIWLRKGVLGAVVVAAGVLLVRPHTLRAQGTGQSTFFLALATGSQEVPPVESPAVALARFTLTADHKLNYEIHVNGLMGDFTAMHLHRGRPGQAGPIVYPLTSPFANNVSTGSLDFKPEDEADLNSQGFYFNLHTSVHPDGEIRGQVVSVPENFLVSPAAAAEISFAKDIQPIFTASCALPGCHAGNAPQEGMNLAAGQAFANIVGVKSKEAPTLNRIEPGDPQKSYLWHKINGTQSTVGGSGARMPMGRAPLPNDPLTKIRQWIEQGAKNN